ncbi:MAG: hypothetical protein M0R06_00185 [Sphaerochaeta sp.]|jgi:hypothetical protein|nr:hypothetical protein [Sphaerochaeta sp.]
MKKYIRKKRIDLPSVQAPYLKRPTGLTGARLAAWKRLVVGHEEAK